MTAFLLSCMLIPSQMSKGAIYFKSVNDCTYYSERLSGQTFQTPNGSETYKCICKLVPKVNPNKVRVY